ncbi:hypothetical protein GVAV_001686 [Gurleya vavrai]
MIRNHTYAQRGVNPNVIVRKGRGANVTMILATNSENIIHSEPIIGASATANLLKKFISDIIRIIGNDEKYILIMDNVRLTYSLDDYYDTLHHTVKYSPRYLQCLNPCKEAFSAIKSVVRGNNAPVGSDKLLQRIRNGTDHLKPAMLLNFVQHSESFFPACIRNKNILRQKNDILSYIFIFYFIFYIFILG